MSESSEDAYLPEERQRPNRTVDVCCLTMRSQSYRLTLLQEERDALDRLESVKKEAPVVRGQAQVKTVRKVPDLEPEPDVDENRDAAVRTATKRRRVLDESDSD